MRFQEHGCQAPAPLNFDLSHRFTRARNMAIGLTSKPHHSVTKNTIIIKNCPSSRPQCLLKDGLADPSPTYHHCNIIPLDHTYMAGPGIFSDNDWIFDTELPTSFSITIGIRLVGVILPLFIFTQRSLKIHYSRYHRQSCRAIGPASTAITFQKDQTLWRNLGQATKGLSIILDIRSSPGLWTHASYVFFLSWFDSNP
jgi:hypothetical protein